MSYDPKDFEKAWSDVQDMMVRLYGKLKDKSRAQVIREMADVDMDVLIQKEFGIGGELEKIAAGYISELKAIEAFAPVEESVLQALIKMDLDVFRGKIRDASSIIRKQVIEAVVGDLTETEFRNILTRTGFQPHQAEAMVNDSLRQFSRNVTSEMAVQMPVDTLWVWLGPIDDRTSDECLDLISAGPMTRAEFDSLLPGAFTQGTHYNCRHEPRRFTEKAQFRGKRADKQITENVQS